MNDAATVMRGVVKDARAIIKSAPCSRYVLQSAEDLRKVPPENWLVRGVYPRNSFLALYGPSGSAKSFLAIDMSIAIAGGTQWFGRKVAAAPVVYLCLEGERGMAKRLEAARIHRGEPLPANLRFIAQPFDLRFSDDVSDLVTAVLAEGRQDGLLVLDTLNRAALGADENSPKDMGQLISACQELQQRTGWAVLLVHHTGKDTTKGLRGHSSLFGALDGAIEVSRTDGRRAWTVAKTKDDSDGERYGFTLRVIDVGLDEDGEPVTSCVVEPDDCTTAAVVPKPRGKTQTLVYALMNVLLTESTHVGKAGAPAGRPCVELEAVVPVIADRMLCRPDQREYQTRRALMAMTGAGKIYQAQGGWIWVN